MKAKNLEEALQFLRDRGLTVYTGDRMSVNAGGYEPDAEATDEYGRLVAIVVDDSSDKGANSKRVAALTEYAAKDSRMTLVLIDAPLKKFVDGVASKIKKSNPVKPRFGDVKKGK